jgi:predicted small lipoprotein YifL
MMTGFCSMGPHAAMQGTFEGDNMRCMKNSILILLAAGLTILIAGCGSKGPLYLPDQTSGISAPSQK